MCLTFKLKSFCSIIGLFYPFNDESKMKYTWLIEEKKSYLHWKRLPGSRAISLSHPAELTAHKVKNFKASYHRFMKKKKGNIVKLCRFLKLQSINNVVVFYGLFSSIEVCWPDRQHLLLQFCSDVGAEAGERLWWSSGQSAGDLQHTHCWGAAWGVFY